MWVMALGLTVFFFVHFSQFSDAILWLSCKILLRSKTSTPPEHSDTWVVKTTRIVPFFRRRNINHNGLPLQCSD